MEPVLYVSDDPLEGACLLVGHLAPLVVQFLLVLGTVGCYLGIRHLTSETVHLSGKVSFESDHHFLVSTLRRF